MADLPVSFHPHFNLYQILDLVNILTTNGRYIDKKNRSRLHISPDAEDIPETTDSSEKGEKLCWHL
jgi:hypothetical protein